MAEFINNVPIGCRFCGYGPVKGKESSYPTRFGIVNECSWTCPNCHRLIRRDETQPQKREDG